MEGINGEMTIICMENARGHNAKHKKKGYTHTLEKGGQNSAAFHL